MRLVNISQLLEEKGKNQAALMEWKDCLKFGSPYHPDEKNWIEIAKERLNK
ncbi:MAG: hypothetical protein AAFY21_07090 [Cyanobacteria bacterium J06641_2]